MKKFQLFLAKFEVLKFNTRTSLINYPLDKYSVHVHTYFCKTLQYTSLRIFVIIIVPATAQKLQS